MSRSPIRPVILAGGVGNRLWPVSRPDYPKQFLTLSGNEPMLAQTARRVAGEGFSPPYVLGNVDHRFLIAECLAAAGIASERIVLEPAGRNTAAAIAVAALSAAPDELVVVMPADHVIARPDRLREAIELARPAAERGFIVTLGITPSSAETGYGYIEQGGCIDEAGGVHAITAFHEKPDAATAERYIASGRHTWNAGIFFFLAQTVRDEFASLAPDIMAGAARALEEASADPDFVRLGAEAFAGIPSVPFDIAVMEKTAKGAVVPVDIAWSDIGSWPSIWAMSDKDDAGNAVRGEARMVASRNCLAQLHGDISAVLIGVENLMCVAGNGTILIADAAHADEIKDVVASFDDEEQARHLASRRVPRPWGNYETVETGPGYLVKRLSVKPGGRLSLQYHHHRAEHWVVVSGTARVTRDDEVFDLGANESTYIPTGMVHRLENPGAVPAVLIEVQTGEMLSEDDIVRLDDAYDRAEGAS